MHYLTKLFVNTLIIASLGCLVIGCQELYIAVTNQTPVEISCYDFLEKNIESKWLKLNQCYLDNENVVAIFTKGKNITEGSDFFVPVHPIISSKESVIRIFLKVNSLERKEIFSNFFNLQKNEDSISNYFAKHKNEYAFFTNKNAISVTGKVLIGTQLSGDTRDLLKKGNNISNDFIVIAENEEPSLLFSLYWIVGGLFLAGLFVWWSPLSED